MKATFLFCFFTAIVISLFSLSFCKVSAQTSGSVYINELLPDALGVDSGKEYIELYNNTDVTQILEGWYFLVTSQSGTNKKILIPNVAIDSKSYFVIAEDLNLYSITNGVSVGSGKLALYNDFGLIQLFNQTATLISELNYGDSTEAVAWESTGPACNTILQATASTVGIKNSVALDSCFNLPLSYPTENPLNKIEKIEFSVDGVTWVDTLNTLVNNPIKLKFSLQNNGLITSTTIKDSNNNILENPFTFNSPYSGAIKLEVVVDNQILTKESQLIKIQSPISLKLKISELYPSPESPDKEWIELYNNDSVAINLKDYYIEEKSSSGITNTRSQLKDQIINPGQYYVLYEDEFNVSLNNSGDTIYLFDLNLNKVDEFIYESVGKSQSVAKELVNNEFANLSLITSTPTPNSINLFPVAQGAIELATLSIKDALSKESGFECYIFVNINNYIDKYIFIEDTSLKLKAKTTSVILEDYLNSYVKLKAKVTVSSGVKNLLVDTNSIEVIEFFTPQYNKLDSEFSLDNVASQISLTGIVQEVYSNRIRVLYKDKLVSVYIKSNSIEFSNNKNKSVTIFGTLDFYRNAFRILEIESSFEAEPTILQISFPQKLDSAGIIKGEYKDFDSNKLIIYFGYLGLVLVFLMQVYLSRKLIIKKFKFYILRLKKSFYQLKLKSKNIVWKYRFKIKNT